MHKYLSVHLLTLIFYVTVTELLDWLCCLIVPSPSWLFHLMRCTLSGVLQRDISVSLIHIALCVSALIIYHSTHVSCDTYMKVVLGFVLIKSEYHSVSLGSFSCHFHSSYFQWLVPGAYYRVCVYECCFDCHSLRNSLALSIHFNLVKTKPKTTFMYQNSIHSHFSSLSHSLSRMIQCLSAMRALLTHSAMCIKLTAMELSSLCNNSVTPERVHLIKWNNHLW